GEGRACAERKDRKAFSFLNFIRNLYCASHDRELSPSTSRIAIKLYVAPNEIEASCGNSKVIRRYPRPAHIGLHCVESDADECTIARNALCHRAGHPCLHRERWDRGVRVCTS